MQDPGPPASGSAPIPDGTFGGCFANAASASSLAVPEMILERISQEEKWVFSEIKRNCFSRN